MKKSITIAIVGSIIFAVCALLTGCASYTTTQEDLRYEKGQPAGKITTKVTVRTFWNAKSELAKSTVTQTEKSQSSRVGAVSQTATNSSIQDLTELAKALRP